MILAILQARMSSTRLPGKVLKPILGKPMLQLQVERIKRSQRIDRLIIATSADAADDVIEVFCEQNLISCFRGSLDNVLDRFYQAAKKYSPDHIVRLTGDCPVIDPTLIDQVIDHHLTSQADYTSNSNPPTFPDGLDVEVCTFEALKKAWQEAGLPSQLEHVTSFIHQQSNVFKIKIFSSERDLSHHRWTVDQIEDFEMITQVFKTLYPINPNFTKDDILTFLASHPEVMEINNQITRNEGYEKSLLKDNKIQRKMKPGSVE
jgi:spore coat polysaccharide biosynthesis protein SpsF